MGCYTYFISWLFPIFVCPLILSDMPAIYLAFDQLANLIAQLAPAALLELKASPEVQQRYEWLIRQRNNNGLTPQETDELTHFIVFERLVRMAKIKADS